MRSHERLHLLSFLKLNKPTVALVCQKLVTGNTIPYKLSTEDSVTAFPHKCAKNKGRTHLNKSAAHNNKKKCIVHNL